MWHLFHENGTLLYKVFRAKYFPRSDIFGADLNPRNSFAWKSIVKAREVISNGAWWRIVDGKDIRIWQYHWLPSLGAGKVLSPRLDQSLEVVQGLFILGTKDWDFKLIDRHFLQWEANCIKSIPISAHIHSNLPVRLHTLDGCYSV